MNAQICTSRSSPCERRLILRFFSCAASSNIETLEAEKIDDVAIPSNAHMKETCLFVKFVQQQKSHLNNVINLPYPRTPVATSQLTFDRNKQDMESTTTSSSDPNKKFPILVDANWIIFETTYDTFNESGDHSMRSIYLSILLMIFLWSIERLADSLLSINIIVLKSDLYRMSICFLRSMKV